jgi:hypothetical protein
VGALLAISAIIIAGLVTLPTIGGLVSLGEQVAETGGTPTPVLAARVGALQRRPVVAERVSFALAVLAVTAMASARYIEVHDFGREWSAVSLGHRGPSATSPSNV